MQSPCELDDHEPQARLARVGHALDGGLRRAPESALTVFAWRPGVSAADDRIVVCAALPLRAPSRTAGAAS